MKAETSAIVIGAGPAGLMAAETMASAGRSVVVHDASPSPARKFLLAGRGGLNLTHSEPLQSFLARYGPAADRLLPAIQAFPPDRLRDWAAELGEETFIGSSGRVFSKSFKATRFFAPGCDASAALASTLSHALVFSALMRTERFIS
jgi:predicted flavoprotein YhiN